MNGKPIEILLVEDNPGDVRLTQKALAESKIYNKLHVAEDGEEAMEFLRMEGRHAGAVKPDMVLLDLNLPGLDGREVLRLIKSDEHLKRIPVIILTTSKAEEDILRTYGDYANCYVTKPLDITQFFDVVRSIEDFWLTIVKLPARQ
jgi:CheY-like chemotaxis protein